MHGANTPDRGNYSFTHANRSNSGLSVLLKDTSTCELEEPGIKLPIFQTMDEPLYLLSHNSYHHLCTLGEADRGFVAL